MRVTQCFAGSSDRPLPFASLTLDSQKEATDYLLVGRCPEANEEEEAALTDIIITVLLGSARGPFCGVITVLSSTHHCICHYCISPIFNIRLHFCFKPHQNSLGELFFLIENLSLPSSSD